MKVSVRAALLVVGSVLGLTFLIYRHFCVGVTPKSAVAMTQQHSASLPLKKYRPSTTNRSAQRAEPAGPDWQSQFAASQDLFSFVKQAAGPAFYGDGTAALYVARALAKCGTAMVEFGGKNPEAALQNFILARTDGSGPATQPIRRYFDLCKGFFKGNAFAVLPDRKNGYFSYSYWIAQAYKDHNPIGEVNYVATVLPASGNGADHQLIGNSEKALVSAVASGDSEAVFDTGLLLVNSHGSSLTRALAVAMAGCNMGYDCSTNNTQLFGDCAKIGTCPLGESFTDKVTQALGPAGYAKAYAMAQQLQYAISEGDTATIQQYVQLKR